MNPYGALRGETIRRPCPCHWKDAASRGPEELCGKGMRRRQRPAGCAADPTLETADYAEMITHLFRGIRAGLLGHGVG